VIVRGSLLGDGPMLSPSRTHESTDPALPARPESQHAAQEVPIDEVFEPRPGTTVLEIKVTDDAEGHDAVSGFAQSVKFAATSG
jgi:hypothetical protein